MELGRKRGSLVLVNKIEMTLSEDAVTDHYPGVDLAYKFDRQPPQEFSAEEAEFILNSLRSLVASRDYDYETQTIAGRMLWEYDSSVANLSSNKSK